jgi:riboflavin kinase/FMN adenylyltransferase
MDIYRSLSSVPKFAQKAALAIGNFDGLHRGHQRILKRLVRESAGRGLRPCVLTFSPHPEKIFGPEKLAMIQTLEQRLEGFEEFGIETGFIISFDRTFAGLTARDFVQKVVVRSLQARLVVVGMDFRFGANRQGDISALCRYGRRHGFDVAAVPPVKKDGSIVSSSLIREFLREGRIEAANNLLGRPYAIVGDIVRGDARGQRLGYPTANIHTPNEIIPRGVFATCLEFDKTPRKTRPGPETLPREVRALRNPRVKSRLRKFSADSTNFLLSLTNIGVRPTFGEHSLTIETHILDFQENVYGFPVSLYFLKKIREERTFSRPRDLASQIKKDMETAREYFKKRGAA